MWKAFVAAVEAQRAADQDRIYKLEKMICRILLLLILTSCVSGSFVVNVTQTSYQADENHNITLEWTFTTNPDRSITSLKILCDLIIDHKAFVLYRLHEGVEVSESQDAKFSGRVQSDKDALREGRIRLQLSRLRTDDSGLYLCEVNTDDGVKTGKCQLNVTETLGHWDWDHPQNIMLPKPKRKVIHLICLVVVGVLTAVILCFIHLWKFVSWLCKKGRKQKPEGGVGPSEEETIITQTEGHPQTDQVQD